MTRGVKIEAGAYCWADVVNDDNLYRFVVYVCYPFDAEALALDNDALAEVVRQGRASIEEIDVDAYTYADAEAIGGEAMKRDYNKGGRIVDVQRKVGMYM